MTFGNSIQRARTRCREVLREHIALRGAAGVRIIAEAAPRNASGDIVSAPDGLQLPLRYDLVFEASPGKFESENADSVAIEFTEPAFVTWERTLSIEIHRLCWDYMQFEIPLDCTPDWEWLRDWFMKWFDAQEVRVADVDGLLGVVHFASDPEIENGTARFFVDFGSAGDDALADFLDILMNRGFTKCLIGKKKGAQRAATDIAV
jgi:hypothetical protein